MSQALDGAHRAGAQSDLSADVAVLADVIARATALGLEEKALAPAREIIESVGLRRRLAPQATVVALLGATGSGKSSLFNALAGAELAATAVTRPTTTRPLALLGAEPLPAGTADLLDWLGISQRVQWPARSAVPLGAGTILLDLPDIDSDAPAHREIAQHLAGKVDVLVWVLDPEKYADGVIHHDFLTPMAAHADVTIVVLNQIDRLDAPSREAVLADLSGLLEREGLSGAQLLALSARTGAGVAELAQAIAAVAESRTAMTRRLSADIRTVARGLYARLGGNVLISPDADALAEVGQLQAAAAKVAGVELVTQAVVGAYRHRARLEVGWLPLRWIEALRKNPLRVLHLGGGGQSRGQAPSARRERAATEISTPEISGPVARTSLPEAGHAATGALRIAAHTYAKRACAGLPGPGALEAIARSDERAQNLAPHLDAAVSSADLEQVRPRWWLVANTLQWLAALTALSGGLWLVALHLMADYLFISIDPPRWGVVPWPVILLAVGVALGVLCAVICGAIARLAAVRRGRRVGLRLRRQTDRVVETQVVAPLKAELTTWVELSRLLQRLANG